ncbi:hypothetical protein [Moorena sp. SIO4G3]|uniref:hypothetical protein n=1 Tax=Moorena sp. SIO4G3 TaxID=2607821 RepID=UPI00142901DF|nr:hypothetical protein [Moorena sp. SIO4G3]NEO75229.1 hypothetical protein [Moorena sp. SIO4G3]
MGETPKTALPSQDRAASLSYSLLPTPHTPHPTPYTLHPTPYTPHPVRLTS